MAAPAVVAGFPLPPEKCRKLLGPFVNKRWRSSSFGPLLVVGVPENGMLRVWPATAEHEQQGFRFPLVIQATGTGVILAAFGATEPFKLSGSESHPGSSVVWRSLGGNAEAWERVTGGCSGQEAIEAGRDAMGRGEFAEAAQHFTEALQGSNEEAIADALRARVQALVFQHDLRAACADAELVLTLEPNSHLSHRAAGLASLAAQNYGSAREAFKRALELAPGEVSADLLDGLWEAEKNLLLSRPVPTCQKTFSAMDWELHEVWDFCRRSPEHEMQLRQFALFFRGRSRPSAPMPYILTVPVRQPVANGDASGDCQKRYPLVVYLHSAASSDICKGDVVGRQLELVVKEAPQAFFAEQGHLGPAGDFIGIAPCCPPNLGAIVEETPKALKRRKVYWFKSCDTFAYAAWNFSEAARCAEVELMTAELLLHICKELPVDTTRIFFIGASAGGYAVLRLAELLPEVPAAIVPMAGYYPDIPGHDHDVTMLVERLRGVRVWPMHCESDRLCRPELPHVKRLYESLRERLEVEVEWVPEAIARGSHSNFHSAHQRIFTAPDAFFQELSQISRPKMAQDLVSYLHERVHDLHDVAATAQSLLYSR